MVQYNDLEKDMYSISIILPDGSQLAVASTIGIWLYDVKTRKEISFLSRHTHFVNSIAFSPNGNNLASGSSGNTILVCNVERGEVITTFKRTY